MPLKLAACLLCASLLAPRSAHAGELGAVDEGGRTASQTEQRRAAPMASSDRLVPLAELKSRSYQKTWFGDFRVHDLSLGLSLLPVELSGEVSVPADPAQGRQARNDTIHGTVPYGGVYFAYYLPLLGYTPNFSVGLLPELHVGVGAIGDNFSQTSRVISEGDDNLGTLFRAPLFLMARLGYNASRYGNRRFSVNLGFGAVLVRVSSGNPVLGTSTYLAPGARASVAFRAFELGLESEVARHDDFTSSSDAIRISYLAAALTLSLRIAPSLVE
jgi:hypothetical protein